MIPVNRGEPGLCTWSTGNLFLELILFMNSPDAQPSSDASRVRSCLQLPYNLL
jgi:hypothetical protein